MKSAQKRFRVLKINTYTNTHRQIIHTETDRQTDRHTHTHTHTLKSNLELMSQNLQGIQDSC